MLTPNQNARNHDRLRNGHDRHHPLGNARFAFTGIFALLFLAAVPTARGVDRHVTVMPDTSPLLEADTADPPATSRTDQVTPNTAVEVIPSRPIENPAGDGGSGWPPKVPTMQRLQEGWPQDIGMTTHIPNGVTLADVDDDGDLEVIAGSSTHLLYVWHHDGTLLPGWPVDLGAAAYGKCAAADLDLDGDLEIIYVTKEPPLARIRVLHHDGTSLAGWPQFTEQGYGPIMPTIYDLDGDGSPEILWGNHNGVVGWHADGSRVSWYPATLIGRVSATLAVGDLDGDDLPEILATTVNPDNDYGTYVYVLHSDGTIARGWPFFDPPISGWGAPSIGDLDGDGINEALAMTSETGSGGPAGSRLFAFDIDGTIREGFPLVTNSPQSYSSPTLADIDHDGDLEIFQTTKAPGFSVFGWDHLGNDLPGWPVHGSGILGPSNLECSPVVANLDSDPELEVLFSDNLSPGTMFAHNPDGSHVFGFPYWALPGIAGISGPATGDIDADGDLEIAMVMYEGIVGVWDLQVPWDPTESAWTNLYHDNWNTNQYGFVPPDQPVSSVLEGETAPDTPVPGGPGAGAITERLRISPNPASGRTQIGLDITSPVRGVLQIFDTQGRLVRAWADARFSPESPELVWDGRDQDGKEAPTGVYNVRFRIPHNADPSVSNASWKASVVLVR